MIGTSAFDYYFIRICIFFLHYLAPICLLYSLFVATLYGFKATTYRLPLLIESVATAETLFYLLVHTPYRIYLQRPAEHPAPPSREERRKLFALCNENIPDVEEYLQKWFLGAPAEEIKKDNMKEFLLWAFFNRDGDPGDDDEELEEYIAITEEHLGRTLESGRGNAECLRLTLDRVDMLHRSLTWYFCVGFVDFLAYIKLLLLGFQFHRNSLSRFFTLFPFRPVALLATRKSPAKHITYWHRPHTSSTKLPIVFIHGIGIGLYSYTNFLSDLKSTLAMESDDPNDQVGIIALEIMPVSFRITHSAIGREEMCKEIDQILQKHMGKDQKFVLVSHSYGSVISTHLLKMPSIAARIGPVVLVDPVSILLHLPDVAYNFTRRKPKRANEHQLYYFASMDMGVSHTLSRHFFWSENVIWKGDLAGRRVTVSLGGKDLIVDTESVGRYLTEDSDLKINANGHGQSLIDLSDDEVIKRSSWFKTGDDVESDEEWKYRPWTGEGIDVLWFSDLDHAQVFDAAASRKRVVSAIKTYSEEG